MEYCVWPDGAYCEPQDLNEMMLCGKSDDFELIDVEDEDEIHERVMEQEAQFNNVMEALLCCSPPAS